MDESELYAYRAGELEHMFDGAASAPQIAPLERARALTKITRVHARIEGTCRLCARAVRLVDESLERQFATPDASEGACDAALDLLRVLARDSTDASEAIAFAQRWGQRSAQHGQRAECVAELRSLATELASRKSERATGATKSLVIAPPRARDVGLSGHEAARFATDADADLAQLISIERLGGASPPTAAGGSEPSEVRVVLAFDRPAQFRRGELPAQPDAPRRIVLDFEKTKLATDLPEAEQIGGADVARVRASALESTTARVEFEVGESTHYRLFFLPRPYRVVLDFTSSGAVSEPDPTIRTIVLDPGHGGVHSGARGPNGLSEAEVALSLALRVRGSLSRTLPDPRVVLTREDDRFVSLEERTAIANAVGADLFVSIHLNASPVGPERGGVSTFVLDATHDSQAIAGCGQSPSAAPRAGEGKALSGGLVCKSQSRVRSERSLLDLAARENDAAPADLSALSTLFGSLVRREQVARSLDLAQVVHRAVLRNGRRQLPALADRGVKPALFYVLVGARMPAILCEASFLTRPEEAEALRTDQYRQLLADGIAEGIARYVRKVQRARTVLTDPVTGTHP